MAPGRQLVVSLDGVFDADAVARIEEALACVDREGTLRVDLSRVDEFQDLGVAALAQALRASAGKVPIAVHGLRQHQLRLLGYLGVLLDRSELVSLRSARRATPPPIPPPREPLGRA